MKNLLLVGTVFLLPALARAQVGIGTTAPDASAALEVRGAAKGLLVPRVALALLTDASTVASPATSLLVYNTTTALGVGYYYNAGTPSAPQWQNLIAQTELDALATSSWRTTGNALTTTGILGSTTSQPVDLYTGGVVRGRMGATGAFFWGGTTAPLSGGLFNTVSNASLPWALQGFSAFNGGGVYGDITAGTTTFGAVQGENNSSTGAPNSTAVRGLNASTVSGNAYYSSGANGPISGVIGGISNNSVTYAFGVAGSAPASAKRTGGVLGSDATFATGALGYYANDGLDYSLYGFGKAATTGAGTGRSSALAAAGTHIGLGVSGGLLGGWVRGQVYGLLARGERYSLYVDGAAVTNQPLTQLVTQASGERVATYAPTATTADVSARGRAALRDGQAFVAFPAGFAALLASPQEATITVTPTGDTHGVYVAEVTETGFWVRENQGGRSQAVLNWQVTGQRRDAPAQALAPELLARDFDARQQGLMHSDAEADAPATYFWWDGQQLRTDAPPAHPAGTAATAGSPR